MQVKLKSLEDELATSFEDASDQVAETQRKINSYYEKRTKGTIFRSRARWYGEGERSTKYFFNLEKLRYNQRTMFCLVKENGTMTKNQKEILDLQAKFYSNLYTSDVEIDFKNNTYDGSKLTNEERYFSE